MTEWNYRATRTVSGDEDSYEIREAYYDEKNEIRALTETASTPFGETPRELYENLEMMLRAFDSSVLFLDDNLQIIGEE